jgi:hypothetical protein
MENRITVPPFQESPIFCQDCFYLLQRHGMKFTVRHVAAVDFFWVAIDIPTIIFRNSPLILGHLIPFIVISPKISTIKKDEFHSHIVPHSYMAKSMEISIINVN